MSIGPWEIVAILVVLVILLGVGRLSGLGGAMGKSVRQVRSAVREVPVAPPAPVLPPVTCPACGASNSGANRFCSKCGASVTAPPPSAAHEPVSAGLATAPAEQAVARVEPATASTAAIHDNICPSCATSNPPGQPFCGQCGTGLGSAAA